VPVGQAQTLGQKAPSSVDLRKEKGDPEDSSEALDANNPLGSYDPGNDLAAIEYVGLSGISKECQDAVLRFIQFGNRITRAIVLSSSGNYESKKHCFLLTLEDTDLVAVKSGFASGYGGEGPRRFSYVLQVLDSHGAEIEEYSVPQEFVHRLDSSALTRIDLEMLKNSRPCHPSQWHDYVRHDHFEDARKGMLWQEGFPPVIPFALIDSRIFDLALSFWSNPDNNLLLGYRRLEDIVRERTGLKQHHGSKLFSQAFNPRDGALTWKDLDEGERAGRMQLFIGTYSAHPNPRAHVELGSYAEELLREFLLLNHLYRLEKDSLQADDK
jgi:Protein of unknown function (Hypoth_ymh)